MITLPLWLFIVIVVLAAWAALDRLMVPSVRWFVRQRTNRVIEQVNTRLPIEIPQFNLTRRQVLIDRLMYDPRVVQAAEAYAREHVEPREVVMERVERYAREIVPAFNAYLYFRIGYWAARRLARLLYRVRLGYSDEAGLAGIAKGSTVVFVMNHRSNMDYVLVGYLASKRAALSYAVGEWARIWPLQALIRSMGAYFVRRNSGDELYRRVLERYVGMATSGGVTQAVYPEGGLTRDGRLRRPKLGLLDYILRAFDPRGERDLVFIPVGINYDRTLEDRTLLLDLHPERAKPRPLAAATRSLRFLGRNLLLMARSRWHRFGYACVNFGTPVSMRAWCARHGVDFRAMDRDERHTAVESLGGELMRAVGAVVPVVPVSLVATVFVRDATPLSELELKARVRDLMQELRMTDARVYIPRRDMDYAVTVGLRMLTLRHLVREHDGLFTAAPDELQVLAYYANSIAHLLPPPSTPSIPIPPIANHAAAPA
jgi:glycerol-3-phosphate O-acyltransferase